MTDRPEGGRGTARLHVYRFPPGASFEGGLVGAAERGGTEILDALFVMRDPDGGVPQAIDLASARGDGTIVALLDFRLDPRRRQAITRRTLAPHPGAVPSTVVEAVADSLEPGGALLAILFADVAPAALEDAVSRIGGRVLIDQPVTAAALGEVAAELHAAV